MVTKLPIFASESQEMTLMQTRWASVLNQVLNIPLNQDGVLLKSVELQSGANSINHKLGRKLVGWIIVRLRSSITVYDTQDSNERPQLTLDLVASGAGVVDLYVF